MSDGSRLDDLHSLLDSISLQSFTNIEIIVVSGGVVNLGSPSPKVKLLKMSSELGASAARNFAAATATGDILGFLDDDIILDSGWCRAAINAFKNPLVGAVSGKTLVDLKPIKLEYLPKELMWVVGGSYWTPLQTTQVFGGTGMNFCVRRNLFSKVGGYDVKLGPRNERPEFSLWKRLGAEESELALRILFTTGRRILYEPSMIAWHRQHWTKETPLRLFKRSLHVGHNRAYIGWRFRNRKAMTSDNLVAADLMLGLFTGVNLTEGWKRFSVAATVVAGVLLGYLVGKLEYRYSSHHQ